MTKIIGTWNGCGFEVNNVVSNNVNNTITLELNITLTFTQIQKDVYNVKSVYTYKNAGVIYGTQFKAGDINHQANFLINKFGDKFVAEDDSGMGIDYFKFDEKELHFNYNTNGLEAPALFVQGETLSQVGKYKLKKC